MKDFGVQVNLPLLTAGDLKGDDLKTRFYTGFVNFWTFTVLFNSLKLITGKLWVNFFSRTDIKMIIMRIKFYPAVQLQSAENTIAVFFTTEIQVR